MATSLSSNRTHLNSDAMRRFQGGTATSEVRSTFDNRTLNQLLSGTVVEVDVKESALYLTIHTDDKADGRDHRLFPLHAAMAEWNEDGTLTLWIPGYGPTVRVVIFTPPPRTLHPHLNDTEALAITRAFLRVRQIAQKILMELGLEPSRYFEAPANEPTAYEWRYTRRGLVLRTGEHPMGIATPWGCVNFNGGYVYRGLPSRNAEFFQLLRERGVALELMPHHSDGGLPTHAAKEEYAILAVDGTKLPQPEIGQNAYFFDSQSHQAFQHVLTLASQQRL